MAFHDNRRTYPAGNAAAITPSNTVDLDAVTRALYVGVTGDVKVDMIGGQAITFKNVPVCVLPIRVTRVYATGTDASEIIGLW